LTLEGRGRVKGGDGWIIFQSGGNLIKLLNDGERQIDENPFASNKVARSTTDAAEPKAHGV
jgi:hypothetical protein